MRMNRKEAVRLARAHRLSGVNVGWDASFSDEAIVRLIEAAGYILVDSALSGADPVVGGSGTFGSAGADESWSPPAGAGGYSGDSGGGDSGGGGGGD